MDDAVAAAIPYEIAAVLVLPSSSSSSPFVVFPVRTYCCFVAAGTCLLLSLLLNCNNTVLRVVIAVAVAIIVP